MPLWSAACAVAAVSCGVCAWAVRQPPPPPVGKWTSGALVTFLRCTFLAVVVGTLCWSYVSLGDVMLCSDDGQRCLRFAGSMQFTTFTRWCWMLQAVYYALAVAARAVPLLSRACLVLFEVCVATALLVTTVTYTVLIPGALLTPQPPHRRGAIELLLSTQGHIMHSMNTVFILSDYALSRSASRVWMAHLPYGIAFGVAYVLFEWAFHSSTGFWHYPFMNYDLAFAEVAYLALFAAFTFFWRLAAHVSGAPLRCKGGKAT